MKRRLAVFAVVACITLLPAVTSALGLVQIVPPACTGSQAATGCTICQLAVAASNTLNDGIYIAIFLSAILFAWAGWQMVIGSSSGNIGQRERAKHIFMYVTGGLVLILAAWIIVSVIMSVLTKSANWNSLCGNGTGTSVTASPQTTITPVGP